MLNFQKKSGDFFFHSDRERSTYSESHPQGLFDAVKSYPEIVSSIQSHQLLTCEELELVEDSMGKQYLELWGRKLGENRTILHSKDWFAFDLDDTLHDFRKASSTALLAVLSRIKEDHGTNIDEMQKPYRFILVDC